MTDTTMTTTADTTTTTDTTETATCEIRPETHSELTTIPTEATTDTKTGDASAEIFVALNRLKKSPRNVRKVPHTAADIEALAASIQAKGLLQNLVVEPELKAGEPTGFYLVTIGEGHPLAALSGATALARMEAGISRAPRRSIGG